MKKRFFIFSAMMLVMLFGLMAPVTEAAIPYGLGTNDATGNFAKLWHDWMREHVWKGNVGDAAGFTSTQIMVGAEPTTGLPYGKPEAPFDSPAFERNEVHSGELAPVFYTTNEEIVEFLKRLPKNYLRWEIISNVSMYNNAGGVYVPELTWEYPVAVFSKGPNGPVFDPEELRALGKPIFFMDGSVHAGEPQGSESLIAMMKRLAYNDPVGGQKGNGDRPLDYISVVVVPRYNLDGAYNRTSNSRTVRSIGYNQGIGEDSGMFNNNQTRLVAALSSAYRPHMAIDLHGMNWTNHQARYYPSGEFGVGTPTTVPQLSVPIDYGERAKSRADFASLATNMSIPQSLMWGTYAYIDLATKFASQPATLSDKQDELVSFIEKYFEARNMYATPYLQRQNATSNWRVPGGVELPDGSKVPGDINGYFRVAECVPDESFADAMIGLMGAVTLCSETPTGNQSMRMSFYGNFLAQQAELQYLINYQKSGNFKKDIETAWEEFKTDTSDVALWNLQTPTPYQHKTLKVSGGVIPDPATGQHYFEYQVPYRYGNLTRVPHTTVQRPKFYIIDPTHSVTALNSPQGVPGGVHRINPDLVAFRLAYTGIPIYRLTKPYSILVTADQVDTIQAHNLNAAPVYGPAPIVMNHDADGNYTGGWYANSAQTPATGTFAGQTASYYAKEAVEHLYYQTPEFYTGGSVSLALNSSRIVKTTQSSIMKTFPAGSYVVPVHGKLTNSSALYAMLLLEPLARRNMGNSYWSLWNNANNTPANAAWEWPHRYYEHFFPVQVGSNFPAYKNFTEDLSKFSVEPVFAKQAFINGAIYTEGYPVNVSLLKEKGFNLGQIAELGMGYDFMVEGTALVNNAPAGPFYVTLPSTADGVALKKWYLYDWSRNAFVEAALGKSPTSGVNTVNVSGSFIGNGHRVALVAALPLEVLPDAWVEKLNGNKNNLNITVTELYPNGAKAIVYQAKISIDNNAAGTYQVGPYKVYVDTKGNTQIRACYIVK